MVGDFNLGDGFEHIFQVETADVARGFPSLEGNGDGTSDQATSDNGDVKMRDLVCLIGMSGYDLPV